MGKAAAFLFASLLLISAPAMAQSPVTVDAGTLRGTDDGTLRIFKGIPYAAPPVGALRWEPPAAPAHWTDIRDASAFGAICPQARRPDGKLTADQKQSEDCLFANVWAFAGATHAPVTVWLRGGAFRVGDASQLYYNGSDFAKDGAILVTFNYRLGALGFFGHPALTEAATPDASLVNYGIMDQIAALEWVKRNIAAFGGDPGNVTVFGQSAGGSSVLTLLTTPSAKGLFAKAIVESGGGWPQVINQLASDEDKAMETLMHACWVSFAKTGKPVCGNQAWPAYNAQTDTLMEFGPSPGPRKNFRKERYDALQNSLAWLHGE